MTSSLWLASRAAGVTAYVALSLEVVFGLFLSTSVAGRWIARARLVEVHRWLSGVTLALTGAHALALAGDRFARFDALDLLIPFAAPFRHLAVGLGIVALYMAVVVHASDALRGRIGARAWRALHYLAFAVYALATAHGLAAGSDARLAWVQALYAVSAGVVLALISLRVASALVPRRAARARPLRS